MRAVLRLMAALLGCLGALLVTSAAAAAGTSCQVKFVEYQSSPLEATWLQQVGKWQDDVCAHTPDSDVHLWLGNVADYMKPAASKYIETTTRSLPEGAWNNAFSVFTHERSCADSTGKKTVSYIHTPIEPTASIARDPRKCWEQLTETYTQSKAYLVPMSGGGSELLNGGSSKPRSFLFDAGATVTFAKDNNNTDTRVDKAGWSGTNWIYDWYKSVGVLFDEVHAWEPPAEGRGKASGGVVGQKKFAKKEGKLRGKSRSSFLRDHRLLSESNESFYPDGVLHFYNIGVTDAVGAKHNPLDLIKRICKPEDFVVFKLDIDSKFEIHLVHRLLRDPELISLVDDFYYEHHVHNQVMRMHGLGKNSNSKYTLQAWYDMATSARKKGLRMHFWP